MTRSTRWGNRPPRGAHGARVRLWVIGAAVVAAHLAARPALAQPAGQPVAGFEGVGIQQRLGRQVPLDLEFVDEKGKAVRLGELLDGRPVILNLIYFRCPMLCNQATNGLIRSLRGLSLSAGDAFSVWTISFDADEGPKLAAAAKQTALQRYGRPKAAADWHFLTGSSESISRLTEAVGFAFRHDPVTGQFAHAAGLIILTPEGKTSRYLLGVEYAPRDVRLSLVEASQGKIGSITDHVLLYCYRYDPASGKYGLLIQNVIQLSGGCTVMVLGLAVGAMLWRERRAARRAALGAGADPTPPLTPDCPS